jgi:hypothetical protein
MHPVIVAGVLVLAVSTSLTPPNAATPYCHWEALIGEEVDGQSRFGVERHACSGQAGNLPLKSLNPHITMQKFPTRGHHGTHVREWNSSLLRRQHHQLAALA